MWCSSMSGCRAWMVWRRYRRFARFESAPEVIMISGHGTIETAVRATKLGAFDFLENPLSIDKNLITSKMPSTPNGCVKKTVTSSGS